MEKNGIKFLLLYILIIFFSFNQISSKSISFPFHIISNSISSNEKSNLKSLLEIDKIPVSSNEEERMCLEFCFGTPKACHLLTIHSQSFLIWVMDARARLNNKKKLVYDATKSTTSRYNQTVIEILLDTDKSIKGNAVHDRIYTKDSFLFRGFFLSVIGSNHYTDEGMIGLGYRGSRFEEEYSFVNQLFYNGLIYHRVFTQYFEDDLNGIITFGEIPQEFVKNYKNYGRCAALNIEKNGKIYKNRKWECGIDGIYFGDFYDERYVYKLQNSRTSFFSFRKRALVPKNIFDYLANHYFRELLQKDICQRVLIGKYDTIRCNKEIIQGPKINLIYGDWVMSLPVDKLIVYKKNRNHTNLFFITKKILNIGL